jgi:hypothetical protein
MELNGTTLSGATSSTLTFTDLQTTDAVNHTVVVTNLAGSATSVVAMLTVANSALWTRENYPKSRG